MKLKNRSDPGFGSPEEILSFSTCLAEMQGAVAQGKTQCLALDERMERLLGADGWGGGGGIALPLPRTTGYVSLRVVVVYPLKVIA